MCSPRPHAGKDAECWLCRGGRAARTRCRYLPLPESVSPWQPALPEAPWAQHRHCSPATVIAASPAGGTDIFSRFQASLETGSLTSQQCPPQLLSLLGQAAYLTGWACLQTKSSQGWVTNHRTAQREANALKAQAFPGDCTRMEKLRQGETYGLISLIPCWCGSEA